MSSNEKPIPGKNGRRNVAPSRRPERDERSPARIGAAWITWFALLVLPVYALTHQMQAVDGRILFGFPLMMSVVAFLAYRTDKRRARNGQWRISESTLHIIAVFGGWPGAFLAQRRYRHKTAKVSFQFLFWAIVVVHHLVAADSLFGWRFASRIMNAFS